MERTVLDTENFTNIRSLLGALAEAMNLVNPSVSHHHEQTAYLTYIIARELTLPQEQIYLAVYAALLHDVGSVVSEQQKSVAEIERDGKTVSMIGAQLLYGLPGFERIADVVAYCQYSFAEARAFLEEKGEAQLAVLHLSAIVHLADKVSLMLNPSEPVLNQSKRILNAVEAGRDSEYYGEAVAAFKRISELEYIWMDVMHNPQFLMIFTGEIATVTLERTVRMTRLMSRIIDYRSPFTAMHSAGVSASAKKLAELAGMSKDECLMMEIAGNLHDIGKLRVPNSILEKPGKLTDEEFNIIKEHPYYTRLILMNIDGFDKIADWAGYHHEKLNGRGYPFHFNGDFLDQGARIMAVADIFSAITEERPYRKGMSREQATKVMKENVEYGAICGEMVQLLFDHYNEVDAIRDYMSREEGQRYFQSFAENDG